jgi:hypothetical protein
VLLFWGYSGCQPLILAQFSPEVVELEYRSGYFKKWRFETVPKAVTEVIIEDWCP